MTSIMILTISVCEVEIGHGRRATVVVPTEVLRRGICKGRDVKGFVMLGRLSKLVHVAILIVGRVESG